MSSRLDITGVVKAYGTKGNQLHALDHISLSVEAGEFFTLLGPSGCGKTTLLRLIAGFDWPDSGDITLDGVSLLSRPAHQRPINTVFQNYALFPHLTVANNIAFGLEMRGLGKAAIRARIDAVLALVKLEGLEQRLPAQLSGGQQQRVALARALAADPKVLLLDEPLSALDLKLRKAMQLELKRLQKETGITFIFITHDQGEALTMSDRIAVMSAGRVLQIGTPADIYDRPNCRFVADFIGDTNFLKARRTADNRVLLCNQWEFAIAKAGSSAGDVTLAIRPERILLGHTATGPGLQGIVRNIIYAGTDTQFLLALDDGQEFIVRQQNQEGSSARWSIGAKVGLTLPPEAIQVLED